MAFRQKGEDGKDMTPMHMSMSDAWIREEEVQQGFPNQEGGPRTCHLPLKKYMLNSRINSRKCEH
jgi:hypothetical protein